MSPIYLILQKYLFVIIAVQIICLSLFNTIVFSETANPSITPNHFSNIASGKIPLKKPFHPGQLIHKAINFHPYTVNLSKLLPDLYSVNRKKYPSSLASIVPSSNHKINLPPPKNAGTIVVI
jgi:hypothetical protein